MFFCGKEGVKSLSIIISFHVALHRFRSDFFFLHFSEDGNDIQHTAEEIKGSHNRIIKIRRDAFTPHCNLCFVGGN